MTTAVIADDHEVVRKGLCGILEAGPCRVLGEASDGLAAAELCARLKPHVLFLDLAMPRLHGLEVLRQTRMNSPHTRIIVLTLHTDEPEVIEALRSGASAFVLKGAGAQEIIHALQTVLAGRRYLSARLSEWAIDVLATKPAAETDPLYSLTPRERLVAQLAAEGCSNTEVGEQLFISSRTAETHRNNLLRKLGLRSQTDLVRFAIRKGLIEA